MSASQLQAGPGFGRETAVLATGLAASQLVLLAVMPLWSRLYGPEQFAAFGVWTAVSSTVAMLVLLRYDAVIVAAADDAQALALRRLGLGLALGGGVLLLGAAVVLPVPVQAALGLSPLGPWLPAAVIAGMLTALAASGFAWLNRQRAYARIGAARGVAAVVAAVAGSALGWWWQGTTAALLLSQLVAAAAALLVLPWRMSPHAPVLWAAWQQRDAVRYLWPAALLDAFTQQLPLLLVAAWFTAESAGQFSLAWRVLAVPAFLLAAAAGNVFYQRFARVMDGPGSDLKAARALMLRTWKVALMIGLGPALVVLVAGEPLFSAVFGQTWREAGVLAVAMTPLLLAMAVSSPTSSALIVLQLQRWAPLFGMAMLVYRPAAFWLGAHFGSLPLAIAAWTVCEMVAIVLYNRLLLRALASRPA